MPAGSLRCPPIASAESRERSDSAASGFRARTPAHSIAAPCRRHRRRRHGTGPIEWPTYGGNLASHRYSPADQITKDNFNRLEIAWRLKTDFLGPRPDTLYSATPLLVGRVLYTTAGMRRAAIALNAATGEMLWMHTRGRGRARRRTRRATAPAAALAYWASAERRAIAASSTSRPAIGCWRSTRRPAFRFPRSGRTAPSI